MEKSEMIKVAVYAVEKRMDKNDLYYSDDMYDREKYTDDVWDYVEEYTAIGSIAFATKYERFLHA